MIYYPLFILSELTVPRKYFCDLLAMAIRLCGLSPAWFFFFLLLRSTCHIYLLACKGHTLRAPCHVDSKCAVFWLVHVWQKNLEKRNVPPLIFDKAQNSLLHFNLFWMYPYYVNLPLNKRCSQKHVYNWKELTEGTTRWSRKTTSNKETPIPSTMPEL